MTNIRKKLIIIGVAVIAVIAIITAIFACDSNSDNSGKGGGTDDKYTCTVTFDLVGGTINGNKSYKVTIDKNSTVARPSEIPQRDGYVFWGWNTTGDAYDTMWQFDVEKITKDMTIFAAWKPECTVTFYADGGTFEDGTDTYTFTVAYGDMLTAPKVTPPNETMEIAYWATESGDRWDFSEPTIGNFGIELYANWDIKKDLQRALAPFRYGTSIDGYRIFGVTDKNVSELTVPSIITSIGRDAFSNCHNLVSVVIPDSVTEIGQYAFKNCEKLKSVTLPAGLTSIANYTFIDCSSLRQVKLGDNVTTVGGFAFYGCSSLEDISLPDTVTEIGEYAFNGCSSLKQIRLPDTVTEVGECTFSGCSSLGQIQLSDALTEVGEYAFYGCSSLKQIRLPDTVTEVGEYAFYGCSSLEDVRLSDTLTEVGEYAFRGCSSLLSIAIPNGVTEVKHDTFEGCTALKQVKLGNNVTVIDYDAFSGCSSLEQIQLPDTLTSLGNSAFMNCSSLKSITVPSACEKIGGSAFQYCTDLTSAELHCETIDYDAFENCTALASVTFGAEVRTIGSGAFDNCIGLTEIEIPDYVTQLHSAFYGCSYLRNVKIGNGVDAINSNAFSNCVNLRSVTIGSGVKEIKSYAFRDCKSLLSITIPSNVETVASNAFYGCSNLMEAYNLSNASLSFDSYVTVHTDASEESVVHYTDDGFLFVTRNDKPTLVKYLGDKADIVLPDDCKGERYSISDRALAYLPQLNSVKFSAGVKEIGDDILLGSDNVTSLTVDSANPVYSSSGNCVIKPNSQELILCCKTSVIPDDGSVRSIMNNVFCHNATIVNDSFRLPDSVKYVYRYAFEGCYGIMRTADNGVVYVDKWVYAFDCEDSDELVDIELDAGTVGICNAAFYRNNTSSSVLARQAIRSVKFNAELKYVGDGAFACCPNLTEIIMNDGLLTIMNDAFYGCNNLQDVVVPDSVSFLGPNAFGYCANLKYVKLPASSVVQQSLFSNCKALESVVIPQAVTLIGQRILLGCPDTVAVYYEGSEEQWSAIRIDDNNDVLNNATKYFYSETEIEGVNCWHYGADGKPTTEY